MPVRPWGVGGSVGWDDDDDNTGGTGMQPWGVGGSVTWRSGSNTVLLSGGKPDQIVPS